MNRTAKRRVIARRRLQQKIIRRLHFHSARRLETVRKSGEEVSSIVGTEKIGETLRCDPRHFTRRRYRFFSSTQF